MSGVVIGTAGWTIPRADAGGFAAGGSALERYAGRLCGVEVNSSFHRPHRRATWERWRDATPAGFRFVAKLPRAISHERGLIDCREPLSRFLDEVGGLGAELALLLLQLPPKLAFEAETAASFLDMARAMTPARILCEPRHPSWFDAAADALLRRHEVARVAADPAVVEPAGRPGGWPELSYYRLHGSPQVYRSSYDDGRLETLAARLAQDGVAER